MMQYMASGKPFSIVYITYNWATGRGGAIKMINMAVKTFVPVEDGNKEIATNATSRKYSIRLCRKRQETFWRQDCYIRFRRSVVLYINVDSSEPRFEFD